MTTKAKEAPETNEGPFLYDAGQDQIIPLTLEKNGRSFRVTHTLRPLTDTRFFSLTRELEREAQRSRKPSTAMSPKFTLWQELVRERGGYADKPNWKENSHPADAIAAINALLHTQIIDEADVENLSPDIELFDEDAPSELHFRALQSGVLMEMSHTFRQETQAELDAAYAIENGGPDPNALASAQRRAKEERYAELGRAMLVDSKGYAPGSEIPAWHLGLTAETFFGRQASRMGKYSVR